MLFQSKSPALSGFFRSGTGDFIALSAHWDSRLAGDSPIELERGIGLCGGFGRGRNEDGQNPQAIKHLLPPEGVSFPKGAYTSFFRLNRMAEPTAARKQTATAIPADTA